VAKRKRDHVIEGCLGALTASCVIAGTWIALRSEIAPKDIMAALGGLAGIALGIIGAVWSGVRLDDRKTQAARERERKDVVAACADAVGWLQLQEESYNAIQDFAARRAALTVADAIYRDMRHLATAVLATTTDFTFRERAMFSGLIEHCTSNTDNFQTVIKNMMDAEAGKPGAQTLPHTIAMVLTCRPFMGIMIHRLQTLSEQISKPLA